jgi:ribonuclease HI
MSLFKPDAAESQEWAAAQESVRKSVETAPDRWSALAACPVIEIYTDGSAPVRNPGGPAGFAAVVVGFYVGLPKDSPERPEPAARLDLGGYVPARKTEPQTSNNRAEIGGILLALEAVLRLGRSGWTAREVTVWSDSRYAVLCATGEWKRKKNTDLWAVHDELLIDASRVLPKKGFRLEWVRGHAGNRFNEAADELATLAAFNFDRDAHKRFRAAQAATGREMPGPQAMAEVHMEEGSTEITPQSSIPNPHSDGWLRGADYALAVQTRFTARHQSAGTGTGSGEYRIWASDGRSRQAEVEHEGKRLPDEFEYMTLIAALREMAGRLEARGRDPKEFALLIYSGRELVVKQLKGEYKVKAAALQEPYRQAAALLRRFKGVEIEWKRGKEMDEVMREGPL